MHCLVLLLIDLGLIALSTASALVLRDNLEVSIDRFVQMGPYLVLTMAAAVPVLLVSGLNRTIWRFSCLADYLRVAAAVTVTVLVTVSAGFILNRLDGVARSLPIIQGLLMACTMTGVRIAMRLRYAMRARVPGTRASICEARENVLVVGLNATAELFLRCVAENADGRVLVAGLLGGAERHRRRLLGAYPVLGLAEQLEKVLRGLDVHGVRVDRIVVAKRLDRLSAAARDALLRVKSARNIHIDVLSERIGSGEPSRPKPDACEEAASAARARVAPVALDLEHLASRPYLRWKRLLDAAAAAVIAVALAPLMLLVGLVVILDGGYPPIFWQQRPGALGRPIRVLKFRTMRAAYDQQGRHLADDARISIVGRFLRRSRLDELPQVYNILIGQMSLVGPRPLLPTDQSPGLPARLAIRPGLTGWAQVKGGRDLTVQDKAALDIWYIKHASFRLDLVILLSTLRTIVFGERVDRDAIRQAWRELGGPDAQLR